MTPIKYEVRNRYTGDVQFTAETDLRTKLIDEEGFFELSAKIGKLPLPGADDVKHVAYSTLDHGSSNPAEIWFTMISKGDKPGDETGGGFASAKALEWAEEWIALNPDVKAPKTRSKAVAK